MERSGVMDGPAGSAGLGLGILFSLVLLSASGAMNTLEHRVALVLITLVSVFDLLGSSTTALFLFLSADWLDPGVCLLCIFFTKLVFQ